VDVQGANVDNNRVVQLEQALEQEHRNQKSLRDQYENQIRSLTIEFSQQIESDEKKINQYMKDILGYE